MAPFFTSRKSLFLCLFLVGGMVGGDLWQRGRLRATLEALEVDRASLERTRREAEVATRATEDQLLALVDELQELQAEEAAAASGSEAQLRAWLRKAARLQQLFDEEPNQSIPELTLLSDLDWLRLSHEASFETTADTRRALASVRTEAKSLFVTKLADAMRAYLAVHDNALPANINELAALIDPPVETSIFRRYQLRVQGKANEYPMVYDAIVEAAPIDREYDSRWTVGVTGSRGRSDSWQSSRYLELERQAQLAYFRANNGASTSNSSELLPYFENPAERELYQTVEAYRRSNSGRMPLEKLEILPLVQLPATRELVDQIWPLYPE